MTKIGKSVDSNTCKTHDLITDDDLNLLHLKFWNQIYLMTLKLYPDTQYTSMMIKLAIHLNPAYQTLPLP